MDSKNESHYGVITMKYYCDDCIFVFEIFEKIGPRRKLFCPKCGDDMATKRYQTELKEPNRRKWVASEIELIDKLIKGEVQIYALSNKLNRTVKSIKGQMERRLKNETSLDQGAWTEEEEKTILAYIDEHGTHRGYHQELSNILDRTRNQVCCKLYHMRKNGMLGENT